MQNIFFEWEMVKKASLEGRFIISLYENRTFPLNIVAENV
jgi:hypothetical protein